MSVFKPLKEKRLQLLMDSVELFLLILSIPLSYYISGKLLGYFNYRMEFDLNQYSFFGLLILISWFVLSQIIYMAKIPGKQRFITLFFHFVRIHFLNLIILILLKYVFNLNSIPLAFIFLFVPVSMLIIFTARIAAFSVFNIYRLSDYNLRRVMIVADGCSERIIDKILGQKDWGYKVSSIFSTSRRIKEKYQTDIKIYSEEDLFKSILDNNIIDEVIYSKSIIDEEEINDMLNICNETGVIFRLQSCSSPADPVTLQIRTAAGNNKLALVDTPSSNIPFIIKRMADIYFSITAVLLLSPLFLLIALIIKLESRGPVLFKQDRVGLRGRRFTLYKFRTMVANAEHLLADLREKNEMDGPAFKIKDDPRITRFGKFLRSTGIDEFPQLFNVISGKMSLIGPRPPLESEIREYERWQLRRLSVMPGITCTWQVVPNRNDVKFEKWMQLDLNYIDNWSLTADVKLFFQTITSFLSAGGR